MNDELSQDGKALLAAARASFSPDPQRVAAVRAALDVRIGTPAAEGSGRRLPGRAGAGTATYVVGLGLVATALAGGVLAITSRHGPPRPAVAVVAGSPPIEPGGRVGSPGNDSHAWVPAPAASAAHADVLPAVAVSDLPVAHPPHRPLRARDEPPPPEPAPIEPAPAPPPVGPDDSLAREVSLLRAARAALEGGHAEQALALLQQHAQAWPRGVLAEERLATQVFALCALGRVAEAGATARKLESAAPSSPHLARVRTSCAGGPATAAP